MPASRRAASFAGDVVRLLILAKQMRAVAVAGDQGWIHRRRVRADRRAVPAAGPLRYRRTEAPRWVSPEQWRQLVRDLVLLRGRDPALWPNAALAAQAYGLVTPPVTAPDPCDALDGQGARAARYRADLAAGRFHLPPDWAELPHTTRPQEASP